MISNARQLGVAQAKLQQLRLTASQMNDSSDREAYLELAKELEKNIEEYEQLASGTVQCFPISSLDDVGEAVVKARIALSWSQTRLAEELGVTPQMVQKDEAREYEMCSLSRLADILDTMGFELVGAVRRKTTGSQVLPLERSSSTAAPVVPVKVNPGNLRVLSGTSTFPPVLSDEPTTGGSATPLETRRIGSR